MQGYLEVSQAFQCASALAEEWVSEKASEYMGWRWAQVEEDRALRVAERGAVHSIDFDVGVEGAFQVSSGEVLVLAVPVASWETAQCHSEVVLVLQAVAEPFEPAPTDPLCQFDWLMAGVGDTEWPLVGAGYTEWLLGEAGYIG